ncbi:8-amino-7-oxononanoate synthase [Thiotrichales bacterium 19S3-7]|nr:8-amino-7-oxononanoate synthase [Thiotrichales bacterium 19S3-7]MCF6802712.1 8-amino-7-oxononanoate synthase [Thiotrichales bacterium 19S3-11]
MIEQLAKRLESQRSKQLWRDRLCLSAQKSNTVTYQEKQLINFSSNDYLSLRQHPTIKSVLKRAIDCYGFGSGASAMVSGYTDAQKQLEETFAEFVDRPKALFFNSGYHANLGVFTSLANRHSTILADKLIHASIIDGIHLSRAKHIRYQHLDIDDFLRLMQQYHPQFAVTESIFSMEGDLAPLHKMTEIAKENAAILVVDDAHGIGLLGAKGQGCCEHFNLDEKDIGILVSPLGKAIGGLGAFVSGSSEIIDSVLQFSRSYHYTTALPAFVAEGLLRSIDLVKTETWRRQKLKELILFFIQRAQELGLELVSEDLTPIKSIVIKDNQSVLQAQDYLLNCGFLVSAIRPPTVPAGTARIRISLNVMHTEVEISQLLECLAQFIEKI